MNIQIFGTKKCSDTRKAERFFKERGIKYQFIDMKEKKNWCRFFEIFGVNPLFLYVLSEVAAIVIGATGSKPVIYEGVHFLITDPYLASAVYALAFTLLMGACGYPLYKKKIYIKI